MATPAHHFLIAYSLPDQAATMVLAFAASLHMPGITRHPLAEAPAAVKEKIVNQALALKVAAPAAFAMSFPRLPLLIGELASWLLPRTEHSTELLEQLHALQAAAPKGAGRPGTDPGHHLEAGDRTLAWMLHAGNGGLCGSADDYAAALAGELRAFLRSPGRFRLQERVAFLGHFAELTNAQELGDEARNVVRGAMGMASEYHAWDQIDPAKALAADLIPGRGAGILRRLAEGAVKGASAAETKAYANALTNRLLQYLHEYSPLPADYPAARHRAAPTDEMVSQALAGTQC